MSATDKKASGNPGFAAEFARGAKAGLPVIIGYVPIAIAYGMLGVQSGLSLIHVVLMSLVVYAGASQFMGVNMLAAGASGPGIILTTLVLNLRHIIMSLSLMSRVKGVGSLMRAALAFGITDESFAVASMDKKTSDGFLAGLFLSAYSSWVLGSLAGGLLADIIPEALTSAMGVSLYAMFIGLLVPSVRKSLKVLAIVIPAALLCYALSFVMDRGWAIILATLGGSAVGLVVNAEDESGDKKSIEAEASFPAENNEVV